MKNGRARGGGMALKVTSPCHIEAQVNSAALADLLYRIPDQPAADGSTVDMDRERTQFADNSLKYQTDIFLTLPAQR